MRGSYAAKTLAPYGLPPATFTHIFGVVNSTSIAPVLRSTVCTVVLISARMIFIKSSKSLRSSSLFLSLWNASFTRRSNAFTRFSAASINVVAVSRAFSISRAKIYILVCDVSNLAILDHQPSFRILAPGVRLSLRVRLLLGIAL
jgi:hypothetical protein